MAIIGAHVSMAGGHVMALEKAVAIGCNAMQTFSASPKGWNFARLGDAAIEAFVTRKSELGIKPVYFHASYLVNFADTDRIGPMSIQMLTHELKLASRMGIRGSIVHLGSFKTNGNGMDHLCDNIRRTLSAIPEDVYFIIENAGNRKIGLKIEEIGQIIHSINDPRLRVCLDTCHLHAAGYDLSTNDQYEEFMDTFDRIVGIDKIELWHINDSRDPYGSMRDRHENLGEGYVGQSVFENIVNNARTRHMPMILETPGYDGLGPDAQNVATLTKYMSS